MKLSNHEVKLIQNYLSTIERHYFQKIVKNTYLKIPYKEVFIQKLCIHYEDEKLIEMIISQINHKKISNEDIYFCLNYYYYFNKNDKNNIQSYINQKDNDENVFIIKLKTHILLFCIKYYQFYYISHELLSENNDESHELFFYFYIIIQDNDSIQKYCKKYFKFKIIYHIFNELIELYSKIFNLLKNNDLVQCENNIHQTFKKQLFLNWYKYYKHLLQEDKVDNLLKKYEIKKNILNKLICSHLQC